MPLDHRGLEQILGHGVKAVLARTLIHMYLRPAVSFFQQARRALVCPCNLDRPVS